MMMMIRLLRFYRWEGERRKEGKEVLAISMLWGRGERMGVWEMVIILEKRGIVYLGLFLGRFLGRK